MASSCLLLLASMLLMTGVSGQTCAPLASTSFCASVLPYADAVAIAGPCADDQVRDTTQTTLRHGRELLLTMDCSVSSACVGIGRVVRPEYPRRPRRRVRSTRLQCVGLPAVLLARVPEVWRPSWTMR